MASDDGRSDEAPPGGRPAAGGKLDGEARRLDKPVQEHLGKQLRSTYHVMTEKPAFLGEAAVPPQFDGLIHKLEARDRQRSEAIHDKAVAAVETALQDIGAPPAKAGETDGSTT